MKNSMMKTVAAALRGHRALETLDVSGNDFGGDGEAADAAKPSRLSQAMAKALFSNKVLTSIDLTNSNLGTKGWCTIFHALRDSKDSKIQSWNLSQQDINSFKLDLETAEALAAYISASKVLTSVDLSGNTITYSSKQALREAAGPRGDAFELKLD